MTTQPPTDVPAGLAQLRAPFPPDQVGTLPGRGGSRPLSYVGHADLTARLLDCDPFWTWEPFALDAAGLPAFDDKGNLWIRLTVCGVTRIGVGDAGNGKGAKECIGDALRNAGMRFGAALELWAKGDRDYAHSEQERPDWYGKTLDLIAGLEPDVKERLREWIEAEGHSTVPGEWSEAAATAIRHRAHQLGAR